MLECGLKDLLSLLLHLHRDFLPSSWGMYAPTIYDLGIFIGSFGMFFSLVLLFVRVLPAISLTEFKAVTEGAQPPHSHNEKDNKH